MISKRSLSGGWRGDGSCGGPGDKASDVRLVISLVLTTTIVSGSSQSQQRRVDPRSCSKRSFNPDLFNVAVNFCHGHRPATQRTAQHTSDRNTQYRRDHEGGPFRNTFRSSPFHSPTHLLTGFTKEEKHGICH